MGLDSTWIKSLNRLYWHSKRFQTMLLKVELRKRIKAGSAQVNQALIRPATQYGINEKSVLSQALGFSLQAHVWCQTWTLRVEEVSAWRSWPKTPTNRQQQKASAKDQQEAVDKNMWTKASQIQNNQKWRLKWLGNITKYPKEILRHQVLLAVPPSSWAKKNQTAMLNPDLTSLKRRQTT